MVLWSPQLVPLCSWNYKKRHLQQVHLSFINRSSKTPDNIYGDTVMMLSFCSYRERQHFTTERSRVVFFQILSNSLQNPEYTVRYFWLLRRRKSHLNYLSDFTRKQLFPANIRNTECYRKLQINLEEVETSS